MLCDTTCVLCLLYFFFFKQKTAYEMRISDWSSDVCSSDLIVLYGKDKPALLILTPGNGEAPSSNGVTVGFAASSQADVDAFHKAGLAAGGVDEGAPGPRGHLPNAYAAYLRDPAGNKVCAYTFV